jgi:hypothetical protein
MGITISRLNESERPQWDPFVDASNEGTIFHTLRFLDYHGAKFDEHHLVIRKGQSWLGVMPMAINHTEGRLEAKSPYGASFGGAVFAQDLTHSESMTVFKELADFLRSERITTLSLTLPPVIFDRHPNQTKNLSLHENNFQLSNRDITSVVSLDGEIDALITSRARNMVRKAEKQGLTIQRSAPLEDFQVALDATFRKHGTTPTHSPDELRILMNLCPSDITVDVAYQDETPVAGICFFRYNNRVNSSFYFANPPEHQNLQGLSLLIVNALKQSQEMGYRWFDFGTSSVQTKGRPGVFRFKESFNASGWFRETYEWTVD